MKKAWRFSPIESISLLAIIVILLSSMQLSELINPTSSVTALEQADTSEQNTEFSEYFKFDANFSKTFKIKIIDNFEDFDPDNNSLPHDCWTGDENTLEENLDIFIYGRQCHKAKWNTSGFWASRLNNDTNVTGFDASDYNYLSFDIKGEVGNESFHIIMEDEPDNESTIADIRDYTNITTSWQVVNIPLLDLIYQSEQGKQWYCLEQSRLKAIKFEFDIEANGTIYFDDLRLNGTEVLIDDFEDGNATNNSMELPTHSNNCSESKDVLGYHIISWNNTDATWNTSLWDNVTSLNLSVRLLTHLSFKIRGGEGRENFRISLMDTDIVSREILFDQYYTINQHWQRFCFPLTLFQEQGLEINNLTQLSLIFNETTSGTIQIDDLRFIFSRSEYISNKISTGNTSFVGDKLYVNNSEYKIRGVAYQPTPVGYDTYSWKPSYTELESVFERDFQLLSKMHCNTIRTWARVDTWIPTGKNKYLLLDKAEKYGIKVVCGFFVKYDEDIFNQTNVTNLKNDFKNYVSTFKNHSAVLMWIIGNEQNLRNGNNLEWYTMTNEMAYDAYQIEGTDYHPVGTVNYNVHNIGTLPKRADDTNMNWTDFWAMNAYDFDFTNFFDIYRMLSTKPFFLSEYGADAYDLNTASENQSAQAKWNMKNWDQITNASGCAGGTSMEYSDEWWKYNHNKGFTNIQETNFDYPTPFQPDGYTQEEWFGIVSIKDNGSGIDIVTPRLVYYAYQKKWNYPPYVNNLTIDPQYPKSNDNLTAQYEWNDNNSADVENGTEICWYKNDELQQIFNGTIKIPRSATTVGDIWYFILRPKDGIEFGSLKKSTNVTISNTQPNLTTEDNITAYEDAYYEEDYEYDDIDEVYGNQTFVWEFKTNASWLNFNLTTGILNGTPKFEDVGQYWVNITINDTINIDFTNFTLTVVNVNDPPKIINDTLPNATENEFYNVTLEAEDEDSPQLYWNITSNASWLILNNTLGKINGTPTNSDVGAYWVNATVDDGINKDCKNFTLIVNPVNNPPKILTTNLTNATEDIFYNVTFKAEDIDSPQLYWTIITNASWLIVNNTLGIINGTPTNDDVGIYWVNVTVSDGQLFDNDNFSLIVNNTNDPPELHTVKLSNAIEDIFYNVTFEAEDVDSPQLFWIITTNASWLIISNALGTINGTPTNFNVRIYWVNVTVNDTKKIDHSNFTLIVDNVPPTILTGNNPTATEDKLYEEDYNSDDDGQGTIIWSLNTNAIWLSINSNTGVLSGTPKNKDVGWYWVNVSVDDGNGGLGFSNFTLTVLNVNDPPTISCPSTQNVIEDIPVWTLIIINDIDNATEDLKVSTNSIYVTYVKSNSTLKFLYPNGASSGIVRVTVLDGIASDYQDIAVTFISVNDAPTISGLTDQPLIEDITYWYNITPNIADVDNSISELTISTNSSYITVHNNNHTLEMNYPNGILSGTVRVTVSDGLLPAHQDVMFTIIPVNDPPIIICPSTVSVIEDIPKWVSISINDIDNATADLKIKVDSNYVIYLANMALKFLYPNGGSSEIVIVKVSDGIDANYQDINVIFKPVNDAPTVSCPSRVTVIEDIPKWVTITINDVDNVTSDLVVTMNNSYVTYNASNSTLKLLYPNSATSGFVKVTVSDGIDSNYQDIEVTFMPTNDDPVLSNGTVTPLTGDTNTIFNFTIVYIDIENDAPIKIQVIIENKHHDMIAINLGDTNYFDGKAYYYETKLTAGEYLYHFECADGYNGTDITSDITLIVTAITPQKGIIRGIVKDQNDEPVKNVSISIDGQESAKTAADGSYSFKIIAGIYNLTASKPGYLDATINGKRLSAGWTIWVNFTITKIIENNAPILSDGMMTPVAGDTDTEFTFSVTYTDKDNDSGTVWFWIDGNNYEMQPDPYDINFTDGVGYTYKTKLGEGKHKYYFTSTDGTIEADPTTETVTTSIKEAEKEEPKGLHFAIIIIIIIIVIIIGIYMKKRKGKSGKRGTPKSLKNVKVKNIKQKKPIKNGKEILREKNQIDLSTSIELMNRL